MIDIENLKQYQAEKSNNHGLFGGIEDFDKLPCKLNIHRVKSMPRLQACAA